MKIRPVLSSLLVVVALFFFATAASAQNEGKVFVCKYVSTPGVSERLQTGQNPISVSINAIKDFAGLGSWFNDAQGRSFVLAFDEGQPEPDRSLCPQSISPTSSPSQTPTVTVTPKSRPTPMPRASQTVGVQVTPQPDSTTSSPNTAFVPLQRSGTRLPLIGFGLLSLAGAVILRRATLTPR